MSLKRLKTGPSRRGNNGEFSWAPRRLGAPPPLKITDKGVSDGFFPKSNIHEIHYLAGLRPDPGGEAITTLPRQTPSPMVYQMQQQLPKHSVSIKIYIAIAWFACDSTDFFLSKSVLSRLYFQVGSSHILSKSSTWRGSKSKSGQIE